MGINDNHLQRALDYTSQYCTVNCLLLNVNKTLSINFTLQKTLTIDTYNINHSEILYTTNVRLLGVIFDAHPVCGATYSPHTTVGALKLMSTCTYMGVKRS